jgi:glycine/D-amino acid oxidase-like deaminating enzyme
LSADHDLIVVGAGMLGAACADAATAEGLKVLIVEPGVVGGGSTAASMGHLVAVDGDPAELALAAYSERLWTDLRDLPGAEYSRCGTLWVASAADDLARVPAMRARFAAAGMSSEPVDTARLYELEPNLAPGLAGGLLVADEGIVYPPAVARALVKRACSRGAEFRVGRALSLGDHEVVLEGGSRLAGPVLVAAGCAMPNLLPELPIRPRKGHLVITERYPGTIRHQLVQIHYADSAHGDADSVAFNVQPRPTGQVLIGSSREFNAADTAVSLTMVRRMLACAFGFLPGLRGLNAIRVWAGLRPASVDGLPYIGAVPGRRGVWVAGGHEGLGICTAPGSARLLLDLFLGRTPAIDATPYDPARVAAA